MRRVLLTGAAGGVGRRLRQLLPPVYPELRLTDIVTPADLAPGEAFAAADLAALDQVEAVVDGVDAIVHLGGHSVEGPWETILQANIIAPRTKAYSMRVRFGALNRPAQRGTYWV